jgi:ATP/maltotriose-dependent transcriptional regulator MalT
MRAAEKAERREGIREAHGFYARALDVLGDDDVGLAIELRLRRGRTRTGLGDLRGAHDELLQVADDAFDAGRQDLRCAALVALANIDYKQGLAVGARTLLTEAERIASELDDPYLQVRAAYESAEVRADLEGAGELAVDDLRVALRIAEQHDDRALRIEGHMRLGTILFNLCRLDEAEREFIHAATLAGETGSHRDEARTTFQLACVNYYRGDLEDAELRAERASAWFLRTGDTFFELQNAVLLGMLALTNGDPVLAEERLRAALPRALESGGWVLFQIYRYLVEALVLQGRVGEAGELAEFAERSVLPEGLYARAMVGLAHGSVAAAAGSAEVATTRFEEALDLLGQQRLAVFDLAEARMAWARALHHFADDDGARVQLEQARETFASMDAAVLLAEIDALLAELVSGAGAPAPPPLLS